jgi:hypothetical protein
MSKKTISPPDCRKLARAIVDRRLEQLSEFYVFTGDDGGDYEGFHAEMQQLELAWLNDHSDKPLSEAGFRSLERMLTDATADTYPATFEGLYEACRVASFLVGLELGRRIGGTR